MSSLYQQCIEVADALASTGRVEAAEQVLSASARLFPTAGVFHGKLAALVTQTQLVMPMKS